MKNALWKVVQSDVNNTLRKAAVLMWIGVILFAILTIVIFCKFSLSPLWNGSLCKIYMSSKKVGWFCPTRNELGEKNWIPKISIFPSPIIFMVLRTCGTHVHFLARNFLARNRAYVAKGCPDLWSLRGPQIKNFARNCIYMAKGRLRLMPDINIFLGDHELKIFSPQTHVKTSSFLF